MQRQAMRSEWPLLAVINGSFNELVTQIPTIWDSWVGITASNELSKLVQCSEALDSPGYSNYLFMKSISSLMQTTLHTTVTHPPSLALSAYEDSLFGA